MSELTEEELNRYSRHIVLEGVGLEGQQKIKDGKVLIIGAGGLGSPVALYLAAAGVGTIGIMDGDVVDVSNLQRQVIHQTKDVNVPKVESAKEKMMAINPNMKVVTYHDFFLPENALDIIKDYDFVVDCTDNFTVKYLINDVCVRAGKPFSHGGLLRFQGQTMTHLPGTACYRCLFKEPPAPGTMPSNEEAGILGAVVGMLGTIQATEVLKYLTGAGDLLTDKLLTFDALTMDFRKISFHRNCNCPACGEKAGKLG